MRAARRVVGAAAPGGAELLFLAGVDAPPVDGDEQGLPPSARLTREERRQSRFTARIGCSWLGFRRATTSASGSTTVRIQ